MTDPGAHSRTCGTRPTYSLRLWVSAAKCDKWETKNLYRSSWNSTLQDYRNQWKKVGRAVLWPAGRRGAQHRIETKRPNLRNRFRRATECAPYLFSTPRRLLYLDFHLCLSGAVWTGRWKCLPAGWLEGISTNEFVRLLRGSLTQCAHAARTVRARVLNSNR
jgi:hypothetical protein